MCSMMTSVAQAASTPVGTELIMRHQVCVRARRRRQLNAVSVIGRERARSGLCLMADLF